MYLQLKNYHMANEVLYVLDAAYRDANANISKLYLQKVLYLSSALSPIKDVVLTFLRYACHYRGPFSKDIQNTIDHLVAAGLVDISGINKIENQLYVNYILTIGGEVAVKTLIKYPYEEEKHWWISSVYQLSSIYMHSKKLTGDVDKRIMSLVYQEPTYVDEKQKIDRWKSVDFNKESVPIKQLIEFIKKYEINNNKNVRREAEVLLVAFFEYLYLNYINEHCHG